MKVKPIYFLGLQTLFNINVSFGFLLKISSSNNEVKIGLNKPINAPIC